MTVRVPSSRQRRWLSIVGIIAAVYLARPGSARAQEGIDVTARVAIDAGVPSFDSNKGTWSATAHIDNTSPNALFAPMAAVVRGLSNGVVLENASWVASDGSPLVDSR